jgi:hypothetical protein
MSNDQALKAYFIQREKRKLDLVHEVHQIEQVNCTAVILTRI